MPLYQYNLILLINIKILLYRDVLHCTHQIDQEDSENLCPETVCLFLGHKNNKIKTNFEFLGSRSLRI